MKRKDKRYKKATRRRRKRKGRGNRECKEESH
jgi:hypothetical protein